MSEIIPVEFVDPDRAGLLHFLLELEREDPFCDNIKVLVDKLTSIECTGSLGSRSNVSPVSETADCKKEENGIQCKPWSKGILEIIVERTRLVCDQYEVDIKKANISRRLTKSKSCEIILAAISSVTQNALVKAKPD